METSLNALRDQIALWIEQGATLPTVEDKLIEPAALTEDERAALWLFAWAYAKRVQRSSRAVELMT